MSDIELERLRRRKLAQLSKYLVKREEKKESESTEDLLNKVFVGRAWEVFKATQVQYPKVAKRLEAVLIQMISSGVIKRISGEELFHLIRKIGLRVRLKTRIRIKEHGKLKSLEEKMKE